jgi:hypothetical protein
MRHPANFSAAKSLVLLCPVLFVPIAAFADPSVQTETLSPFQGGPLHFQSDNLGGFQPIPLPNGNSDVDGKQPQFSGPNDHMERIPKCQLYFDYRTSGPSRLTARWATPTPKLFLVAKKSIKSTRRK